MKNEALTKLESLIKKWPDQEEALFIAGLTSIDLKKYEKAEKYLVELRNSAEYQNEAYYYLAVNAERKQHFETAKAYYRLVDGSLYTVSRRSLISIYTQQNKPNDAFALFNPRTGELSTTCKLFVSGASRYLKAHE